MFKVWRMTPVMGDGHPLISTERETTGERAESRYLRNKIRQLLQSV
jgi:hypothetical protein